MREYVAILCCNQETEAKVMQSLAEKKTKPLYKFSFIAIPYKKFQGFNKEFPDVPDIIITVVDTNEKIEEVVKNCISEFCFYEKP